MREEGQGHRRFIKKTSEKKIEMHLSFVRLSDLWNKKKFEIFAVIQHFD